MIDKGTKGAEVALEKAVDFKDTLKKKNFLK